MKKIWVGIFKPKASLAKWLVFLAIIVVMVLGALGYFDVIKQYSDTEALTLKFGDYRITAFQALKAALVIVLIFWLAAIVSDIAETRVGNLKTLRPANRALIIKIVQIGIYVVAFLLALDILGIDLTALTVFSGAVGIGLGFGLQKITSNFVSGIILLLEKSVEQDDLVEMTDGTFGFVRKASARFTLIETFDGKEIMIPNEDFITNRVINWTYSNSKARVEITVGVSYGSDIEKARELILEAAAAHPRCINDPKPMCYLRNFGNSSVDFILHFWVADVMEGRWEPQSEVMFEIWRKFKSNGIKIPFPQHDIHLRMVDTTKGSDDGN